MTDTKVVVDAILAKNETISRTGGPESVHTLITRCQNILYSEPCNQSIYIDPTEGTHPFLSVVSGTKQFAILWSVQSNQWYCQNIEDISVP